MVGDAGPGVMPGLVARPPNVRCWGLSRRSSCCAEFRLRHRKLVSELRRAWVLDGHEDRARPKSSGNLEPILEPEPRLLAGIAPFLGRLASGDGAQFAVEYFSHCHDSNIGTAEKFQISVHHLPLSALGDGVLQQQ